ncbi:MAG: hypothetical protein ACOC5T_05150 [Elusimicrobiota bacterium]
MKTQKEIEDALRSIDETANEYEGMLTYEEGIHEALSWVLGDIPDDYFHPSVGRNGESN